MRLWIETDFQKPQPLGNILDRFHCNDPRLRRQRSWGIFEPSWKGNFTRPWLTRSAHLSSSSLCRQRNRLRIVDMVRGGNRFWKLIFYDVLSWIMEEKFEKFEKFGSNCETKPSNDQKSRQNSCVVFPEQCSNIFVVHGNTRDKNIAYSKQSNGTCE